MKKVININLQGLLIPIEEPAYEILKNYIHNLEIYFKNEEGKHEIINDIEVRITELLSQFLKQGASCITVHKMEEVIHSIGTIDDLEKEKGNYYTESTHSNFDMERHSVKPDRPKKLYRDVNNKIIAGVCSGVADYFGLDPVLIRIVAVVFFGLFFIPYIILWIAVPPSTQIIVNQPHKKLYRDVENKVIAGVCSGLGVYFGIAAWIVRILFILPFLSIGFRLPPFFFWNFSHFLTLSFSPLALSGYIILWIAVPPAITIPEKLSMKGEKIDLENIKNSVQTEMEEKEHRKTNPKFQNNDMGFEISRIVKICLKVLLYFILGTLLLGLLAGLFALGIAAFALMPLKFYLLHTGSQDILSWIAIVCFIWLPIIGVATLCIRKIIGLKTKPVWIFLVFGTWMIGLISIVWLSVSVIGDFKATNRPVAESVKLSKPKVEKLIVQNIKRDWDIAYRKNIFNFYNTIFPYSDSLFVRNIQLVILPIEKDSFQVGILKLSNGKTATEASLRAEKIYYNITQKDSVLWLERGFFIDKTEKFRNQSVVVKIEMPIGKRIFIQKNTVINFRPILSEDWEEEEYNHRKMQRDWEENREFIMTKNGLKPIE